jgi:hypothetical protein
MLNGTNIENGCNGPIAMDAMRAVPETWRPQRRVPKAYGKWNCAMFLMFFWIGEIAGVDANLVGIEDVLAGKAIPAGKP